MTGSILQLYYKTKLNKVIDTCELSFFKFIFFKYNNFSIENKILKPQNQINSDGTNAINIMNIASCVSNLTFRVELFPLLYKYKYSSIEYCDMILKNINLSTYYDNSLNENNLFKLNLLLNLISNKKINNKKLFYINNDLIFIFDDNLLYTNNYNLSFENYVNQLKFLYFDKLKSNLFQNIDFENLGNNLDDISMYLLNYIKYNDINLYLNDIEFIISNIFYNFSKKNISLAIKKLFINSIYDKTNNYKSIISYISKSIEEKITKNSNIKFYNFIKNKSINNNLINFSRFNSEFEIKLFLEFFDILDLLNNKNNFVIVVDNFQEIIFLNKNNMNQNSNNNLIILNTSIHINDIEIFKNYSTLDVILFNKNKSINLSTSNIICTNTNFKQYKLILPKSNLLSLTKNEIGNFIIIIISGNLKVVFKIDKIIFNINNIIVYSNLYDKNLDNNLENIKFIKFNNNIVEEKKIKIKSIKKYLIDSEICYNYILNKKIHIDNNFKLNKLILDSIKFSINNNFLLLQNLYTNFFKNFNIIYLKINYNLKNTNNLNNLEDNLNLLLDFKNINIINYFYNKFKDNFLLDKTNKLIRNNENHIIPFVDLINENINSYKQNILINSNNFLNQIGNNGELIYIETIKQIKFLSNEIITIQIYTLNLSANINDTLYLFNDITKNYTLRLKLIKKDLYDLDENVYIYTCEFIDDEIKEILSESFISKNSDGSGNNKVISIKCELFNLEYFNKYKNNNLVENDLAINYCLNYCILSFIILLFNVLLPKLSTISPSGVIINNNNIENRVVSFLSSTYNKYFKYIKNHTYTDSNLNNIKIYDNYNFNNFTISDYDTLNDLTFYYVENLEENFSSNTIISNLLSKYKSNNDILLLLENKIYEIDNKIPIKLTSKYLLELRENNLYTNIFNNYIKQEFLKNNESIYYLNNIFNNNNDDYFKFLNNLLNIENNVGFNTFSLKKTITETYKYDLNIILPSYKSIYFIDLTFKSLNINISDILSFIESNININNQDLEYFLNNINLLNFSKINILNNSLITTEKDLFNYDKINNIITSELLDADGTYKLEYEHTDKTILFNNNLGIIDEYFIKLKNEFTIETILNNINNNINKSYNLFKLINFVDTSLLDFIHKEYLIIRNNIYTFLNLNLNNIIGTTTDLKSSNNLLKNYYKNNILPSIKNNKLYDLEPNLIEFNSEKYIIFNDEYYIENDYLIKISVNDIINILDNINTYRILNIEFGTFNLTGNDVLKEIENVKLNLGNLYYSYKILNLNTDESYYDTINNLLKDNYTQNSIQKYYLYKNCLLTYGEYNLINPKNNFAVFKINDVDTVGKIISGTIENNSNIYTDNQLVCLTYGNGLNGYGNVKLTNDGLIDKINFINFGFKFIKNDSCFIEPYTLPENLDFIDNSFKFLKRKTDLPYEIIINYDDLTLSRRNNNKYYYLLHHITSYMNNLMFTDYTHNFDDSSLLYKADDIISFTQSSTKFKKYNNSLKIFEDKYYTLIELKNSTDYYFNFVKIENSTYYDDIYIIYPTDTNNIFEIKTEFISNITTATYKTGLKIIYTDLRLSKLLNYLNLHFINDESLDNFKKHINLDILDLHFNINLDELTNIYDIINYFNKILNNFDNFNYIKTEYDSNHKIGNKILKDNNETIISSNLNKNIKLLSENLNNFYEIKKELNSLKKNPYEQNDISPSCWIKNLGLNLFQFCELYFNNKLVNKIIKEYFYIDYDLSVNKNNKINYDKLIGNISSLNTFNKTKKLKHILYIKVPFWFCNNNNYTINLNNLSNTKIILKYKLNDLNNLVKFNNNTYLDINDPKFKIDLICDYVYFDNNLKINNNEELFEQIQYIKINNISNFVKNKIIKVDLNFKNSVKDLIFFIIRSNSIANKNYNNYSFQDEIELNPIEYVNLNMNGQNYNRYNDIQLNYINPYKYLNVTPTLGLNLISFSLNFNIPSGSVNLSILDNLKLIIKLKDNFNDINNSKLYIFGKNYNLFKYQNGIGTINFI